jgi:hypothetical protein
MLPLSSCFFTPLICFRIELILALEPQEEQSGIFNCTTLSAAPANDPSAANKIRTKNNWNIFFIILTTDSIRLKNYVMSGQLAIIICN